MVLQGKNNGFKENRNISRIFCLTRCFSIGYAGIKGFGLLVMLPFVLVLIAISAVLISVDINPEIVIPFAILALLIGIVVLSYISSVFSSIFQCALYVYAADGDMPGPFDNGVAESVWKSKKKKK